MALNIIGAGFGRTGTHSLKLALEHLGFGPCYHMYEIHNNLELLSDWQAAARGEMQNWDRVFEGYNAQVDWPGSKYWVELAVAFPNAKVILSVRDPESWFESIMSTIVPSITIGRHLPDNPDVSGAAEMIFETVFRQVFDDRIEDREYALNVFKDHIVKVQNTISPDRLLTLDVKEGWAPLCNFLGVDVPEIPFPRTNSTREFIDNKNHLA